MKEGRKGMEERDLRKEGRMKKWMEGRARKGKERKLDERKERWRKEEME